MNRFPLRLSLKFLLCLLIAGGAYFWAIGLMDSTYAYRSPLDDTPPAAGADLGEPATRRVVWVLIDGLRTDTAADSIIMPVLNRLRAEQAADNVERPLHVLALFDYSQHMTLAELEWLAEFRQAWEAQAPPAPPQPPRFRTPRYRGAPTPPSTPTEKLPPAPDADESAEEPDSGPAQP